MINQSPILIAGPPRSGTTMLAGLLYLHCVWVGRSRTTQYPGTNSHFGSENIDIKNIMKQKASDCNYVNWSNDFPSFHETTKNYENIKKEIESLVPENTKWLVKTSWTLVFCDLWKKMYPNAKWVFTQRDIKSIQSSMSRHPAMNKRPVKKRKLFIEALQYIQKHLSIEVNNITIDVYKLSQKDKIELNKLFEFLNIEKDENKTNEWLQPKMMSI